MSLSLNTREVGEVTIVDVVGRITLGEGSKSFREKIKNLLEQNKNKKFLVNLTGVSYMDSSGLGELFCAFKNVSDIEGGGQFKLIAPPTGHPMRLLLLTKLSAIFEIFLPNEEDRAVKSFN
jgi:anti-sigma B factor antagonist